MIEDQPQKPKGEQSPTPLASPTPVETPTDSAKDTPFGVQMIIGFGTFYALLLTTVGVIGGVGAASLWTIPASLLLLALCVFTKRRLRRRGFVMGALIGLGLLALGGGLCFAIIRASG